MREKTFNLLALWMILTMFTMLLFTSVVQAEFTIRWDPNDPTPDGYAVYAREDGQTYDYSQPLWEGQETETTIDYLLPPLPDIQPPVNLSAVWNRITGNVTVNWTQPELLINEQLYYLVVRAFLNPTTPDGQRLESPDSNEVNVTQANGNTLQRWEVFYAEQSGGPYSSLDTVTDLSQPIITQPITTVPEGEMKTIYFTVVAFGEENTFSQNAQEVSVIVDRRGIPLPPDGVSVEVTVPVQ